MHIDISTDFRQARRFLNDLGKRGLEKAAARAINDTLVTVRKEGAQAIKAAHPALKIGAIKREMVLKKASAWDLRGYVRVRGRPLSLKLFNARQVKRGVTARIGRGRQSLVLYRGRKAFIVPGFDNEVFVRQDGQGRKIRKFRGPSMPGVFRAQGPRFRMIVKARFPVAFRSRIQYEIELAKRRAAAGV